MCGRYSLSTSEEILADHFDLYEVPRLPPRYNIAPSQEVAVVALSRNDQRKLGMLQWGIPRSKGRPLINLRSDTALEVPKFRQLLARRRCLIVTDGFYEWQKRLGSASVPYYVRMPRGEPFALAGVWTRTQYGLSCTILTSKPGELLSPIHDRAPVPSL